MKSEKIKELYMQAEHHMKNVNISRFDGIDKPLFLVSSSYPGVWLEHIYDSLFYADLYPGETEYIKNILELFIDYQTEEGQLPCCIWDKKRSPEGTPMLHYTQTQECVSFAALCLEACTLLNDGAFLEKCYAASVKWIEWLERNRSVIPEHKGLIEMFVGYDTGHDNSGRLRGLKCRFNYRVDGVPQNASVLPEGDETAPVAAVDMNCNYYANLIAVSKMAGLLGKDTEVASFLQKAEKVKKALFELCYDENDAFFYDVDRNGNKRKYLSCTVFHLFLEKVLDKEKDADIIKAIYERHIKNPDEFWTPFPFPAMAYCDPSTKDHAPNNCWGYYTQMLTALRCARWMDHYGFKEDFDTLCRKTLDAWTEHSDKVKFGQELDPITGIPPKTSEWYSSCMLFYVYAARRLGEV